MAYDADHEIAQQAAADVARLFNRPGLIKVVELARAVSKATPPPVAPDGTLPAIRIGNSLRVPTAALQDYLTHSRTATA
jgi:hypothetical protein